MSRNRDVLIAVALVAGWAALSIAAYFGLAALMPGDPTAPESETRWLSLWIIVIMSVVLALGITAAGWWRAIGITPVSEWSGARWLALFGLVTLIPFLGGVRAIEPQSYAVFIAGFALTGFAEEAMYRGVLVKVLEKRSPIVIVSIIAILFGIVHLANIVIRGEVAIIVAQAIGAAADGFGFAALRLRTKTVLPLMALHALHDTFLWMGRLPVIPVAVVQDIIFLGMGVLILRKLTPERSEAKCKSSPGATRETR